MESALATGSTGWRPTSHRKKRDRSEKPSSDTKAKRISVETLYNLREDIGKQTNSSTSNPRSSKARNRNWQPSRPNSERIFVQRELRLYNEYCRLIGTTLSPTLALHLRCAVAGPTNEIAPDLP
jgi:hypothetical protein